MIGSKDYERVLLQPAFLEHILKMPYPLIDVADISVIGTPGIDDVLFGNLNRINIDH